MITIILAAAAASTAVDAERAFAVDAQTMGQWTAFRKWAAPDSILMVPQPANTHEFLKDRKDPPVAVMWWPAESYVSCDGQLAVNTGPWVRNGGKLVGYFTTVWRKQGDSWRWTYDGGDALPAAREVGEPKVVKADCKTRPAASPLKPVSIGIPGAKAASGESGDKTLRWSWSVAPSGARVFAAQLWTGRTYETVIEDRVAAE